MFKLVIQRNCYTDKQIQGIFTLYENDIEIYNGYTIELPYIDNKRNISSIPSGEYKAVYHVAPSLGRSYWLKDVPNRSGILIHRGNYYYQLRGCILVGDSFVDIDGDGNLDVTNSVNVLNDIFVLTGESDITIYIKD